MSANSWTVCVDDNVHYRDVEERYSLGEFDNYDTAVAASRKIVDEFLQDNPAATAERLFDNYTSFGEDPWIKGPTLVPGSQPSIHSAV